MDEGICRFTSFVAVVDYVVVVLVVVVVVVAAVVVVCVVVCLTYTGPLRIQP